MLAQPLSKGDTVGVIAISSPPKMAELHAGIPFLEEMGLRVELGDHIEETHAYFAGTDEARLADFHKMIKDPNIKAIFFACGGYGSGRIIPHINYSLVKAHPKILWGFSDLTYLHTAIRQQTGLVTFHGPMIASDLGNGKNDPDITLAGFNQLFTPMIRMYNEEISELTVIQAGEATGELVGGNLTLLMSTLCTPYEIDLQDKILFLEDINEEPYQIDSKLQQLRFSGKLDQLKGVVLGDFAKSEPKTDRPAFTLQEIFTHYLSDLGIPVMSGFQIGHCQPHFAIPFGVSAALSTAQKQLSIEPAVQSS